MFFTRRLKNELDEQRAELAMLRQLSDQLDRGMLSIRLDASFCISAANQKFATALGYRREQLLGRPLSEIVPPYVTKLPCFHKFNNAVARFEPVSDDSRYIRADGTLAWLNVHWLPVRGTDGKLSHVQGYARDVTKIVEGAKESESFIDALIRSTAVTQFNLDGTVITANERFQQNQTLSDEVMRQMFTSREEAEQGLELSNQAGAVILEIQEGAKQVVDAVGRLANELQ